jgi:hypothetical protein
MKIFGHPVLLGLVALSACAPALAQLSDAQRAAIKSACRGDYMNVCASVPTGTAASLQCLQQHSQQVSSSCQQALAAATPPPAPAASAAPAPAAPAAAAAAPAPAAMPMSEADKRSLLRRECGTDFQKFCSGVGLGGGRGAACLKEHASDLSPSCRTALMSAAPH